ncbi:AraC family transcriptional regulator [Chitinophaga japonensis]|uniref:DUF6597 domain-containing protein n=1 Tax=Chitinophaga japonensis TaxID=104662 RepID=A0A562T575_CHIJA|nr:AraC family transcriptional regulator [Chitinophaga japonensis]TWI88685.1 hypothetical protein LX66_2771 [Chitinophaga japonensis]
MSFHIYRPAANLHPYVKHYYYWHDDTTGVITLPQSLLSLGDQYMVFLLEGAVNCQPCRHAAFSLPEASVIGHFTCSSQLKVKGPVKAVIVQLNAYGGYRMLGINMHSINNYYRNLAKLPGGHWQQLAAQLRTVNAGQAPALLDQALQTGMAQKVYQCRQVEQVADFLQQQNGQVNIGHLAARFRLSRPTLERMFLEVVGLPPKLYAQMLRFKWSMRVVQQINASRRQPGEAVQMPSFFAPAAAAVAQLPAQATAGAAVA